MDIFAPFVPVCDLRLSGQVIYVGSNSLDVKMEKLEGNDHDRTFLLGMTFAFSCGSG